MKRSFQVLVLFIVVTSRLSSQTGYDIAKRMDERKEPTDLKADLTMVLTNAKGKTRTSTIRSVSKDGAEKQMIWFLAPADDKGVSFLKIERRGKEDEMRLWLPAFKKVRRISSKKKGDSFMGSDLSYEDLTNRELNENTYELLGSEIVAGTDCYVLEIIPKPEVESAYSRHVTWVGKDDAYPVKEESYDRTGRLLKKKVFTYTKIKDYTTPREIYVENVQKGHNTRLTFDRTEVDTGVGDNLFQEKNLKRLPAF